MPRRPSACWDRPRAAAVRSRQRLVAANAQALGFRGLAHRIAVPTKYKSDATLCMYPDLPPVVAHFKTSRLTTLRGRARAVRLLQRQISAETRTHWIALEGNNLWNK